MHPQTWVNTWYDSGLNGSNHFYYRKKMNCTFWEREKTPSISTDTHCLFKQEKHPFKKEIWRDTKGNLVLGEHCLAAHFKCLIVMLLMEQSIRPKPQRNTRLIITTFSLTGGSFLHLTPFHTVILTGLPCLVITSPQHSTPNK